MQVTVVQVKVKPEHVADFIAACRDNHVNSIEEHGNLRFDILQMAEDPTQFVLYEAYVNAEAAAAHKSTAHYLHWRDTVAPWMAVPRVGVTYQGIFPQLAGAERLRVGGLV